ncbi:MAG: hypothetical protein LBF94_02415 [Puniceicoccales bacterium]|jgi:hypothetical protein|nr:hypothetical protein [Puniceicoccales bacterium]
MREGKEGIPEGGGADSERILAEVRAQMAENERKNREHFARMEKRLKEHDGLVKKLKALDKKNDAIWAACGIKVGQDGEKNPFLILEQIAPEPFKGMSKWTEKSRQRAIEEAEALGFNYAEIKRKAAKKMSGESELRTIITSTAGDKSSDSTTVRHPAKKAVRRVRL